MKIVLLQLRNYTIARYPAITPGAPGHAMVTLIGRAVEARGPWGLLRRIVRHVEAYDVPMEGVQDDDALVAAAKRLSPNRWR